MSDTTNNSRAKNPTQKNTNTNQFKVNPLLLIGFILTLLKLYDLISWSWGIVFIPFYLPAITYLSAYTILIYYMLKLIKSNKYEQRVI